MREKDFRMGAWYEAVEEDPEREILIPLDDDEDDD